MHLIGLFFKSFKGTTAGANKDFSMGGAEFSASGKLLCFPLGCDRKRAKKNFLPLERTLGGADFFIDILRYVRHMMIFTQ